MRILMTGANGFLGSVALSRAVGLPGNSITALRFEPTSPKLPLPVTEAHARTPWTHDSLSAAINDSTPTHILHIGALASPEACERDPVAAELCNVAYTRALVEYAGHIGAHVTFVSTDLVFDGVSHIGRRLRPEDPPAPRSVYARTKRMAETLVLESGRGAVVRSSLIYGHAPSTSKGVLGWMEKSLKARAPLTLFHDEFRTPIHVEDLTATLLTISRLRILGLWHCGGPDRLSRVEFGEAVADALGYDKSLITPSSRHTPEVLPPRPEDVSLDSTRLTEATGISALDVRSALATYREWR